MPGGRFSKQADWFSGKLNNVYTETALGGALSTAPAGLIASQYQATMPGDRIIFAPSDALFWSNNNVGTLYTGTYRYVSMNNSTVSDPERGRAAFWDLNALGNNNIGTNPAVDGLYQVTSDEAANIGVALFAGVFLQNVTTVANNNYYWWIQESGKATVRFRGVSGNNNFAGPLSGTGAIGGGVYLAGASNANAQLTVGLFDVAASGNATTNAAIDAMMVRYVGPAETLPSAGNLSIVDLTLSRASFRW
jgi:hypothetical protein